MATQKENFLGRCFTLRSAYGSFRKVSFGPEDLKKLNEFAASNKGWCSILIKDKKNAGPEQSDFYCEMDTFKAGNYKPSGKSLPF